MADQGRDTAHLTAERVASYLDGYLTTTERDAALAHFAVCSDCRREMTGARRVLATSSPSVVSRSVRFARTWRRVPVVIPVAVAAVLAFAVVRPMLREQRAANGPTRGPDRFPQSDVVARLATVSPGDGAAFVTGRDRFVWRAASGDAEYRLTVMDGTGGIVWSKSTGDTSATVPAEVSLTRGQEYFWSVDALLADGHSTTTRVHHFFIR